MAALLSALAPHPAYVTGRSWNLLAANDAALARFEGFAALPAGRRNLLWWMFAEPGARRTLACWPDEARRLLARFRAAAARHPGDPVFPELRDAVLAASAEARAWWPDQAVLPRADGTKAFLAGPGSQPACVLRHLVLQPQAAPDQKVIDYLPADRAGHDRGVEGASAGDEGAAQPAPPGWAAPTG